MTTDEHRDNRVLQRSHWPWARHFTLRAPAALCEAYSARGTEERPYGRLVDYVAAAISKGGLRHHMGRARHVELVTIENLDESALVQLGWLSPVTGVPRAPWEADARQPVWGTCSRISQGYYLVGLQHGMEDSQQLTTLAHECIHVAQWERGHLERHAHSVPICEYDARYREMLVSVRALVATARAARGHASRSMSRHVYRHCIQRGRTTARTYFHELMRALEAAPQDREIHDENQPAQRIVEALHNTEQPTP